MKNQIKYLSKVEISGLWGQYDLIWNLNNDVNVLAGINGSGKSTVINCIFEVLFKRKYAYLTRLSQLKLFFNNDQFLSGKYATEPDVTITGDHINRAIASLDESNLTREDLKSSVNINIISTFDTSLKPSDAVKKLSDDTVRTELDWEIYQLQKQYLDYQLNISKRKDVAIQKGENNLRENLIKTQAPQQRFLEMINELFSVTDKKVNTNENQIAFLLGKDEKKLSAYQLSSGEKQLLIILLTVLIQDHKPAILLMDEPEISLHMDWQKKLIGYIRELNPNVQLIIATHSPAIIMNGWLDKVSEISDLIVNDKDQ